MLSDINKNDNELWKPLQDRLLFTFLSR